MFFVIFKYAEMQGQMQWLLKQIWPVPQCIGRVDVIVCSTFNDYILSNK